MQFIEHIIEPSTLLLAWQSADENHRTRYIVAEILRGQSGQITLRYLQNTPDFNKAQTRGFEAYPAFQNIDLIYDNVLDAFMRRLPPRTRGDFSQYLEGLRLKPNAQLSDFALLGYSGAKLPTDGFSIIHPFNNVKQNCELLVEAAGFRHLKKNTDIKINIGDAVNFLTEFNEATQAEAVKITVGETLIGYVNRGLLPTFLGWVKNKRIEGGWIEKTNGAPGKPTVYIYAKISASL